MLVRELRARPKPWHEYAAPLRNRWLVCFHGPEWLLQWTAYYLSRWAFLEVLEYLGVLSVLVAVIFYWRLRSIFSSAVGGISGGGLPPPRLSALAAQT